MLKVGSSRLQGEKIIIKQRNSDGGQSVDLVFRGGLVNEIESWQQNPSF